MTAREPLLALAEEDPAKVAELAAALDGRAALLTAEELEQMVRRFLPQLTGSASDLVLTLSSLVAQLDASSASYEQVAEAVANDSSLRRLDPEKRARLAASVAALISAPDLRLAAKAADVLTEYEHVFLRARIFTDVRPVFRDSHAEDLAGAVIVQTLKIEHYGEDGAVRSFFVALDQADLMDLKHAVERAIAKTKSVKGVLESAQLASWKDQDSGDS